MKVLIINKDQSNIGGQEIIAQSLATIFSKQNHKVKILTTKSNTKFERIPKQVKTVTINGHQIIDDKIPTLSAIRTMSYQIRQHGVVLINNPISLIGTISAILTRVHKKPTYCSLHGKGFSPNKIKYTLSQIRVHIALNIACRTTKGLIFLTKEDKKFFTHVIWGAPQYESHIIHNGVDTDFLNPNNVDKARTDSDGHNILFIGRLLESKGVKTILNVAENLNNGQIQFRFAGKGPLFNEINSTSNCTALGSLNAEEIRQELKKCSIFILPSFSECFPVTIVEAMSMETPIIATNIYGIKTILQRTHNQLVTVDDINGIINAIHELLDDNRLRKKCGKENRETVIKKYSLDTMGEKYLKLFTK